MLRPLIGGFLSSALFMHGASVEGTDHRVFFFISSAMVLARDRESILDSLLFENMVRAAPFLFVAIDRWS